MKLVHYERIEYILFISTYFVYIIVPKKILRDTYIGLCDVDDVISNLNLISYSEPYSALFVMKKQ